MSFLALFSVFICATLALQRQASAEDSYVLALSWQPAFCERAQAKPECRTQTADRFDATNFSLHGLWPQPGTRTYCGISPDFVSQDKSGKWRDLPIDRLAQPLWERLGKAMPSTRSHLHRHEWIKHGTCMTGGDAATYFSVSLDLLDAVNASPVRDLFASRIGIYIATAEIRAAFDAAFGEGAGKRVKVSCEEDGNRRLIGEVTIGLNGDLGKQGIATLIHASAPTDAGCPGGVVDAAGLQ